MLGNADSQSRVSEASIGDSDALLLTQGRSGMLPPLNHRLEDNEEARACVMNLGGLVGRVSDKEGNPRGPLWLWPRGLACSRSIGDCGGLDSTVPKVIEALIDPGYGERMSNSYRFICNC